MEKFKILEDNLHKAKVEADKFYVNENMTAGKRYFALLMDISRSCKEAREELSIQRSKIREQRKNGI